MPNRARLPLMTPKLQHVCVVLMFVTWFTGFLFVCQPYDSRASIDERLEALSAKDAILLTLTPLISLIANGIFSPTVKAMLVFWRVKNALPGHRAFTTHVKADPRIDLESLRKRVVPWPKNPEDENRIWYGLYRSVEHAFQVVDAHRAFLLWRDLTSVAFTFVIVGTPATFLLSRSTNWTRTLTYVGVLVIVYAILAIVARKHGVRFVRNVLVEVSHKNDTFAV